MSDIETIRRAAALMRERAEAATEHRIIPTLARGVVRCSCGASAVGDPGWRKRHPSDQAWRVSRDDATQVWDERERLVASAEGLDEASHIASWHPGVALAVADWLDAEVAKVERNRLAITFDGAPMFPPDPHAVAIARAYLGGES